MPFLEKMNKFLNFQIVSALPDRNLYQESEKEDPLQKMVNELQKCKDLLDMGVITQQEFEARKKHLLGVQQKKKETAPSLHSQRRKHEHHQGFFFGGVFLSVGTY